MSTNPSPYPQEPTVAVLKPSGDTTGATDLAAINAAIAATGYADLAKGTFYLNGAVVLTSGQSMSGAGAGITTVNQVSTSANGVTIADTNLADNTVRDLTLTGPGQGTGTGVGILASANSGANSVFRLNLEGLHVLNWGSDGVRCTNLLISTFTRVRSENNGRRGFYLPTGTTLNALSCAAVGNTERGWYLTNWEAATLSSCGGDSNGLGYELNQCQGCRLNACDGVNNAAGGGVDGTTVKLSNGNNNSVANFYCVGNGAVGLWVTSEFDSTIDSPIETAPVGGATASVRIDSNANAILNNPNVSTATVLNGLNTQVTSTQSYFNIASASIFNSRLTGGGNISQGSGVPSKPFGNNPVAGDIYFRTDTPTTGNQRMYICTTGGASPVWAGIV